MNAARVSRGPWKIAAFADDSGLICSQRFHTLWLTDPHWTIKSFTAVLNGPVASAFVDVNEPARDIRKQTLQNVPLPRLGAAEIEALDHAVDYYLHIIESLPTAGSLVR